MSDNKRVLILSENVSGGSVSSLIKQIVEFNIEDEKSDSTIVNHERKPITIIINSYGGSVNDGFALIGAIETSTTPIITFAMGAIMSMALTIFVSGHVRFAHRFAVFMYHELLYGIGGNLTEHIQKTEYSSKLQAMCDDYILERTDILAEKLVSVREKKDDWYFTAYEAKKLGVISDVIADGILWA